MSYTIQDWLAGRGQNPAEMDEETHSLAAKMAEPTRRQARPCPECGTRYSLKILPHRWVCDACGANGDRGLPRMADLTHVHVWSPWFANLEKCWGCGLARTAGNPYRQIDTRPEPTEREKALHRAVQVMKAQG